MKTRARALLAGLAIATTLSFTGASPAAAQYAGPCTVTAVTNGEVSPGATIIVNGVGLVPGTTTPIVLDGDTTLGTATADASGNFTQSVTLPDDLAPGPHRISIFCDSTGVNADDTVILSGSQVPNPAFVTSPASINCSGQLTQSVTGALPGSTVTFSIVTPPAASNGSATANDAGNATRVVDNFGASRTAGTLVVQADGRDFRGVAFSLQSRVALTTNACVGAVAVTGSDVGPLVALGTTLSVLGVAFVLTARRRRRTAAVAG